MINIKQLFYFDIETAGKFIDFDTFEKEDSRGATLFKGRADRKRKQNPDNVQWHGSIKDIYKNNASLISEFGRIVCISYAYYDSNDELKIGTLKGEESNIIKQAAKIFKQVNDINRILCGYNIKSFDIPWIFKKMISYGVTPPSNISTYGKKPWEVICVDLMEVWKSSSWEVATFDEMTYALDVPSPKTEMDGTMVHGYFHAGRSEEIVKYCERDVLALVNAAKKLQDLI